LLDTVLSGGSSVALRPLQARRYSQYAQRPRRTSKDYLPMLLACLLHFRQRTVACGFFAAIGTARAAHSKLIARRQRRAFFGNKKGTYMRNLRIPAALGLLAAVGAANADVSSTVTLTSDYDFRGTTQTAKDPALQASLDYAAENGWYVGGWASNVDFGDDVDINYEVDVYTGFSGEAEGGIGYDVGLIYYSYPEESDANFAEIYGSVSYDWFKGKLWYSNDFGGDLTDGDTSAIYAEANATLPLPQNFSLLLHAGLSTGDFWDDADDPIDYSIGVGYTVNHFNMSLKWVDTEIDDDFVVEGDLFNNEGRVIFTIATTFPWGE
jgi:uncharacterized protein (TIGR02001 family)